MHSTPGAAGPARLVGRVSAAVAVVVVAALSVAWLFLDQATRSELATAARAGIEADAELVAGRLVDAGVARRLLDDATTEPGGIVSALRGTAPAVVTIWDADGTALVSSGEPDGPSPALAGTLSRALTDRLTVVEEATVGDRTAFRAFTPVATREGTGLVLELTRVVPASPVRALAATTLAIAAGAILVIALPLVHRHERLLRDRSAMTETLLARETGALERMNEVDRSKNAFLTAVSHQLRNPLQVIEGTAIILAEDVHRLTPQQVTDLTGTLARNAARLAALVADLLDVDRLVRGTMRATRRHVELQELVATVVDGMDTEPTAVVTSGEARANVDPAHVERIVEHLVRNAVAHAPAGSTVHVDVRRDRDGAELVVTDEGPGVPLEHRGQVFDPLYRIEDRAESPGVGIGLALVQRFAELHGGRAWVGDGPTGGAAFHVRLPDAGGPASVDLWRLRAPIDE